MPRDKNFVLIGDRRFGFHTGSSYHIARRFAGKDYRVAWISYFLSPFHFFGTQDRKEFKQRLRLWRRGGALVYGGNVWSYVPFSLLPIVDIPFLNSRWVMDHSDRLTFPPFRATLEKQGFHDAEVLWIDSSRYAFALDRIPHGKSIFRPSEDMTMISNEPPSFVNRERELLERADVVIAHSRLMIENYRKLTGRKIHFFPNAVDFEFFRSAPADPPEDYARIPSPRVVCLGGMANPLLFDQNLIAHLARRLPGVSFVLLGRVYADVSRLRGVPNIFILGQREYNKIPAYLKNADAGIVPYKKSPHSERIGGDMLKLFEYMACGLPVVSLNFKEFQTFDSPVTLAADYEEFAGLLERAIGESDRRRYVEFARANSWETRFDELLKLLGMKEGRPASGTSGLRLETPAASSRRPKIAVIHPRLQVGGGSESCVLWMLEALKRRYEVTLITSNAVCFDDYNRFYHTNVGNDEVKAIRVPPPILLQSGRRFAALWGFRLNRYCKKHAPEFDLMFSAFNPMDYGRAGVQYVLDPLFNSQMLKILNPTPKKWRRWFYQDSFFRRAYLRLGERLSAFSLDGVKRNITLVDSDWMGRLTKIGLGIETRTLYPPVPDDFSPEPWDRKENGFLCVGRIVPEKQLERVFRVLQEVRAAVPDIHLHIMGRIGDPAYARDLIREAQKHGDWIRFETDASAARKEELLNRHRYGIHGKENEPFGITIAEMIKAGCIVWVPRGGGQVEIVDHPDLTYESIPDGAAKILRVVGDGAKQAELRGHLAAQAKKFSVERFQRDVLDIVDRFLNDHARIHE
ncbi:MAG: glycosyltransferase [Candidatus Aminicenantes bacterium]|nr:glycosyltransferase [Candidatus Aminicenantes bacterium]